MAAPTQVFKSVWFKREEAAVKAFGLAWDDIGTLKILPDHVEYSGKKFNFAMFNLRAAQLGKFGSNPFHRWVKVHFVHEGRLGSLLFSAKGSLKGQNRQLLTALQGLISPPGSQDEVRAIERSLVEERAAAAQRYSKVIGWGVLNIVLAVVLLLMTIHGDVPFGGVAGVVVLITGIGMCVDGFRGRGRTRGD